MPFSIPKSRFYGLEKILRNMYNNDVPHTHMQIFSSQHNVQYFMAAFAVLCLYQSFALVSYAQLLIS